MKRALFALLAFTFTACGSMPTVACGTSTCGPGQYCLATCTCCGAQGGGTPSSTFACKPIPAGCVNVCGCSQLSSGGACTEASRLVEIPCA